jgi:hypothetical protein
MTMLWNRRWSAVAGERAGAALGHVLRAATIAAIASSCSTMQAQSESDVAHAAISPASGEEYPPPPEIRSLTEDERSRFGDFLSKEGFPDIQFLTIAYTDPENGEDKLVALKFHESKEADPPVDEQAFLIPPVDKEFDDAIVVYTGSPARITSCGRRSGGTRYCNF